MFAEAVEVIKELLKGEGYTTFHGEYYSVDGGKIWDLPEGGVPIGIAVSGQKSVELAAQYADVLIATEPKPELTEMFEAAGGGDKPRVGQMPISYGTDKAAAITRAHSLFRWFGFGWKVNADLPGTAGFEAASQFVREEDVESSIPCGDDVAAVIEAAKEYADAGFTHLALVQIGGDQQEPYLEWTRSALLPAWRDAFGS
jgi:G6PDH family F420-dependent oxidoreductase